MSSHQGATNIFREDFACGDRYAAHELLLEEGDKLVDRKLEGMWGSMKTILVNEGVALRYARTDEEISNIIADYTALLNFEMTVTYSVFPELMLLFQEYIEVSMEVWFPADEDRYDEDEDGEGEDDEEDSNGDDNDESDAEPANRADTPLTSGNPCLSDHARESLMKQEILDRTAAVEAWQHDCDAWESRQLSEQAKGKRKAEDQFQSEMTKRKGGSAAGSRSS